MSTQNSLLRRNRTAEEVRRVNSGDLQVTGSNLIEIRKATNNISCADPNLINLTLSKAVIDSYDYYNTPSSPDLVRMVISEIREQYKLHSLVEILQAIKNGRRSQGSLYGKLSPAHIIEWIRQFDEQNTPYSSDRTAARAGNGSREDDYGELMTEGEAEVYAKLAEKFTVKKSGERFTPEQKAAALREFEGKSLELKARSEYSQRWDRDLHGDYGDYMRKFRYEERA